MDDHRKSPDAGRIEAQLAAWGAELDRLKVRVDRRIAEAQQEYYERLEGLRSEIRDKIDTWGPEIREVRERIEKELRDWEPQIDALKSRADQAEDRAREAGKVLTARLRELRTASEGAWGDVKVGLAKAWDDLKPALQSAIAKFR